jgi:hypothetical protein
VSGKIRASVTQPLSRRMLQAFLLTSLSTFLCYVRQVMIPWDTCSSLLHYRQWLKVLVGRDGAADMTSLLNIGEEHLTAMRGWTSFS